MPYIDHEEAPDFAEDDDDEGVTCLHCGEQGLCWLGTYDAAGNRKPKLFGPNDEGPHVCKPSADDFEVLPAADGVKGTRNEKS